MKREHAYKLREIIVKAAASLPDDYALEAVELFAPWNPDTQYAVNDRIRYAEKLYKCVQAHVSQEQYTPDIIPALWTEVAPPGVIPVWKQPTGAHDAYNKGDRVRYPDEDGVIYESLIDANVYSPDAYPQGWKEVS